MPALLALAACGGSADGADLDAPDSALTMGAGSAYDLAAGSYELTAPGLSGYPCSALVMVNVTVDAHGSAQVDACPNGWSCTHDRLLPLGDTYTLHPPKFPAHIECSYDVTVGSFEAR